MIKVIFGEILMTLVEKMMMIEMKQKSESVYESSFVCQSAAAGGAGLTWVPQPRQNTFHHHFGSWSVHDDGWNNDDDKAKVGGWKRWVLTQIHVLKGAASVEDRERLRQKSKQHIEAMQN